MVGQVRGSSSKEVSKWKSVGQAGVCNKEEMQVFQTEGPACEKAQRYGTEKRNKCHVVRGWSSGNNMWSYTRFLF